ncbi:hypothetical protein D0Y65_018138 [Glycine soja]|uniref:Uncharacterized protein n=1 Tax=Glycine soja TaxID=3848 RepID=A0A445JXW8_GLYSO|nr:hypothetical protein D0Y65_018138 [Glycine soja]
MATSQSIVRVRELCSPNFISRFSVNAHRRSFRITLRHCSWIPKASFWKDLSEKLLRQRICCSFGTAKSSRRLFLLLQ